MSEPTARTFPTDFTWGAATASYQVEGAVEEDGRGPSIWDTFSHTPGRVANGDTGDVACDHYHRYREDVALLRDLGLGAYRFSVAWPRVQPTGSGPANPAGLAFYDRLVDELLAAGIEPWTTLYHWDLPQALEDAGGWRVRQTAERFAEYVDLVTAALGDRVRHWITLNEPWVSSVLGHVAGVHAPGSTDPALALPTAHHLLLAHGLAVPVVRAAVPDAQVGITVNLSDVTAASDDPADVEAARRVDGTQNRLFLDPVLRGRYPTDVLDDLATIGPLDVVRDGDLAVIGAPTDFLGVNYYFGFQVAAAGSDRPGVPADAAYPTAPDAVLVDRGLPRTAMGWEVRAEGLTELLRRLHREYPGTPVVITENGSAWDDEVSPDGRVHDPQRVAYLRDHLAACLDALAEGVPLRGYFAWSLLDNFEWAEGYAKRFGIVRVDYDTQARTPKDSARAYAEVARTGRLPLGEDLGHAR